MAPETPNHEPDDCNGDPDLSGNLDSPLPPGRTLSFTKYGKTVHHTNLEADPETGKFKVMVTHGTPAGNSAPDSSLEFSVSPVAIGQKVFLIALAQDVDGDTIGYNWQVPGSDPLPNAFLVPVTFNSAGTKTIKCLLTDMRGGTRMLTRTLSVVQNQPPSLSGLSNRTTDEDTPIYVDFTVSDATTPANQITVTAVSEDQSLVQNSGITVSSLGGGNRRLTITPRPNQHGEVTINVTANDGIFIHLEKFQLTIRPVPPAPCWSPEDRPGAIGIATASPPTPPVPGRIPATTTRPGRATTPASSSTNFSCCPAGPFSRMCLSASPATSARPSMSLSAPAARPRSSCSATTRQRSISTASKCGARTSPAGPSTTRPAP